MRPGSHAADDGSFGRSAGIQVGRAVLLVAIAVVIGILVLHRSGGGGPTVVVATGSTTTTTKAPNGGKTPVTTAQTTTTTAPARPASAVKLLVANGSSVRGLAGLISTKLHTAGYNTLAAANATQQVTTSVVYYEAGFQREAAAVAQVLGLPATAVQPMPIPPPVTNLNTANVLVVTGPDLATAAGTTTTTAHTATTLHTTTTTAHATTTTTAHAATTTTAHATTTTTKP